MFNKIYMFVSYISMSFYKCFTNMLRDFENIQFLHTLVTLSVGFYCSKHLYLLKMAFLLLALHMNDQLLLQIL